MSAASSTVSFPSTDTPSALQTAHPRPPYLPFRRISLPSPPSPKFRESLVSLASFDSLAEQSPAVEPSTTPVVMRNANAPGRSKGGSSSVEAVRRKRRDLRPVNEAGEAKRRKVIHEFYETERAYVDGLELIYSHFLTPIIASLETPFPLLDRSALTSIFSNFIDIWNLHRSFFSSLHSLLFPFSSTTPPLSPILISHFPYLSLYTPFITSFNTTITALTGMLSPSSPSYNPSFASFIAARESDPQCGKLKLRDWLLTIVQRCPRYLLLLKDLINCTDPEDSEHQQLTAVHALVSKITLALNTSLHTHAQTLSLLALQRSTSSLPSTLHFITPGRTLLRRGPLVMLDYSGEARQREFLLFSDCLIWLEAGSRSRVTVPISSGNGTNGSSSMIENGNRPTVVRTRSKSEAELSDLKARLLARSQPPPNDSLPSNPPPPSQLTSSLQGSAPANMKRHASSISPSSKSTPNAADDKWVFKGKAELVDLEVVVAGGTSETQERRFEVLSPEGSFVVFATGREERDAWSTGIRNAKASLLISLNLTHPNSTLTSSASTNHLRRSLQALPFPPHDERIGTIGKGYGKGKKGGEKGKGKVKGERRGRVEHWVPPIWIPDAKTDGCMRCGRGFGWRRRRHHCRLCGRCVCAACSKRTFFISDSSSKESTKAARACDACYETVFPLLDPPTDSEEGLSTAPLPSQSSPYSNTMKSLAGFPSWFSMPSLPSSAARTNPEVLMALDRESETKREPERQLHQDNGRGKGETGAEGVEGEDGAREGPEAEIGWRGRVKIKAPPSRPRSSYEIWEEVGKGGGGGAGVVGALSLAREGEGLETERVEEGETKQIVTATASARQSASSSPLRESTARRRKRFSLPAVALQTTSVIAQTVGGDGVGGAGGAGDAGGLSVGKPKRFSLVLGGRVQQGLGGSRSEMVAKGKENSKLGEGKSELGRGLAAGKLSELLARRKG